MRSIKISFCLANMVTMQFFLVTYLLCSFSKISSEWLSHKSGLTKKFRYAFNTDKHFLFIKHCHFSFVRFYVIFFSITSYSQTVVSWTWIAWTPSISQTLFFDGMLKLLRLSQTWNWPLFWQTTASTLKKNV
jgi:hypothetical protein